MDPRNQQIQGQPAQTQPKQPGIESDMNPLPIQPTEYQGSNKLTGRVALITGGDSGIGRAVSMVYAKEGAHVAIVYYDEHSDANQTKQLIEAEGVQCLLLAGDLKEESFCIDVVQQTVNTFGQLDIVVNNAAVQFVRNDISEVSAEQLEETFQTNFFSYFHVTKAAIPHLKQGSSIISTTSINAYRGNPELIDYSATKGAIVAFTRSLAQPLAQKGIRINMVAPGPVWTPLIPSTFPANQVANFGTNTPMGRPGQPSEHASAYVFLASDESSYMTGQSIHINGGDFISS
ncbi:NAD(P)-dependent dehydrogenase (short-subunit alcohol dehydrogenase family) [Salibacterium salarium]|uniref:SDR family oxidoreductase n=1 Tax=Salibacterium salarium TaxID=284579 RepID=UPI00277E5BB3|nr:SDR family oxidoreductase [Salibacterium salarium]MDQ0300013.1 NAD(P)-dependent dehydrogenase (short-subunit alcohol dehydrogenase family) [Salibacterium salarium]